MRFSTTLGAVVGSMVGDAAGAPLKYMQRRPNAVELGMAMGMCGGGRTGVEPGQVSGMGELTASLYWSLRRLKPGSGFPRDTILDGYMDWCEKAPVDSDEACCDAFCRVQSRADASSESNGALERVVSIPVWVSANGSDVDARTVSDYGAQDASLSHRNAHCVAASRAYCGALIHLLRFGGDYAGAINSAMNVAEDDTVKAWIAAPSDCCIADPFHVRHAIGVAFDCLRRNMQYADGVRHALSRGGDTSTNAAVTGGLLGALHGAESIPTDMLQAVLVCDPFERPQGYSTKSIFFDLHLQR
jgi:ADP-ribosyl-[dinitrogen reductase] hydrolase